MAKKKAKKKGKKSSFPVENVVSGFVLFVAVLVVLSPYIFQFWMTPAMQKKVNQALIHSAYERAPASMN